MAHSKSGVPHQTACRCCRRSTQLRPHDARMWCAMGQCYENEQLKAVDQDKMELAAIQCYSRAVANGDREGIALHKLVRGAGSHSGGAGVALHGFSMLTDEGYTCTSCVLALTYLYLCFFG